ncbi:MAG: hypothetical protein K2N48_07210, partial [Muribaculaceae bacterium]|nr:hypothetical protein [Muribaculaceae bacterium]
MAHITLVERYAHAINKRLGGVLDNEKLSLIAISHDSFKERCLDVTQEVFYMGSAVPQDTNAYVRSNLDVLDKFDLGDYFNTSVQLHPLAAGIWMNTVLEIEDPEIIYPICFHSCPIVSVYCELPELVQTYVDVIMLADKLSSNRIRIDIQKTPVLLDLDLAVFGANGNDFNYTTGLWLARKIGQGKSNEQEGVISCQMYYDRVRNMYPFMPEQFSLKKLGGKQLWPRRQSSVV